MSPFPLPINSALARPLVPFFIRLKVSANAVTLLSLLFGVLGGWCFLKGGAPWMVCGALGFWLANLMDECDGKVARETNTTSRFGALLDTMTDCGVHVALFLGLGMGLFHQFPQGPWLILGIIAAVGSILSLVLDVGGITPWQPPSPFQQTPAERWAWVTEWLRIDFSLLVVISAVLGWTGWILWAGALGVFFFWIPSTFLIAARVRG